MDEDLIWILLVVFLVVLSMFFPFINLVAFMLLVMMFIWLFIFELDSSCRMFVYLPRR